jgi:hypothetical protein
MNRRQTMVIVTNHAGASLVMNSSVLIPLSLRPSMLRRWSCQDLLYTDQTCYPMHAGKWAYPIAKFEGGLGEGHLVSIVLPNKRLNLVMIKNDPRRWNGQWMTSGISLPCDSIKREKMSHLSLDAPTSFSAANYSWLHGVKYKVKLIGQSSG